MQVNCSKCHLSAVLGKELNRAQVIRVLPFLEPSSAELIATPAGWEQIQTFVAGKLEVAR